MEQTLFNIVYEPLRDERGLTSGILNFAYEVTEQVQARRSMERLADELRAEHRRKDDFLAMLAHELRNPLAPIAAAAEVLRLGQASDPRLRRTSEIVTRQVRHMAKLIDDLLDASRVTRGIVSVERRDEDLRDVVADAVEQVTPHVQARRHQLQVSLPEAPVRVVGERKRLVQVLTNLLDNAVKYTPEGGQVALTLEHGAGQARLSVRDNGAGVSPELRDRIFDLFVQGQRSADRAQGAWASALRWRGGWWSCTAANSPSRAPASARAASSRSACRWPSLPPRPRQAPSHRRWPMPLRRRWASSWSTTTRTRRTCWRCCCRMPATR